MKHLKKFNESKDKFKKGTKPEADPNEVTAKGILKDLAKKMGVSEDEAIKRLEKFSKELDKLKNK